MDKQKGLNRLGLTLKEYGGAPSTLCPGCGHNAISSSITKAFHQSGIDPYSVAKMSGIGCSSKSPAYFLDKAHGFNSVHGRMPSVASGANLANAHLRLIGVSGDGDSANIGVGQFIHGIRRNARLVYIVENNGVYGLTKGQFSATSETDAISKTGNKRELPQVDLASLAIQAGANFVARSFSGAPKQLIPLLQAALAFEGTAILDVISPCITFNNHEGSFRSFPYVMEHRQELHSLDFVPHFQPLEEVDLSEGSYRDVLLHDESTLRLRAVGSEYNPHSRVGALRAISDASKNKEHLMGLLYINTERPSLAATKNMVNIPLAHLQERDLRPSRETLQHTLQSL